MSYFTFYSIFGGLLRIPIVMIFESKNYEYHTKMPTFLEGLYSLVNIYIYIYISVKIPPRPDPNTTFITEVSEKLSKCVIGVNYQKITNPCITFINDNIIV